MIENMKLIRNGLVGDTGIFAKLGNNISIGQPLEPLNSMYAMINVIPTSRLRSVEESQLIEIRIIGTNENDFGELQDLQKKIRNNILNNYQSYGLYNLEIFNNSFGYDEHKRPGSVEFYLLKKTL